MPPTSKNVSGIALSVVGTILDGPTFRTDDSGRPVLRFEILDQGERFATQITRSTLPLPRIHKVVAFDALAEHASVSLHKDDEVMVVGELIDYDQRVVQGRTLFADVIDAKVLGPSLRFATARVTKVLDDL